MSLFDKYDQLGSRHAQVTKAGKDPFDVCIEKILSPTRAIINGQETVLAGTNNYLGLTFDPKSIDAAVAAVRTQGTATTGSRIANGTYQGHVTLEHELSALLNRRSTIVFSTGYQANLGVIAGLAGPQDVIYLDADSHASIYDGCRLSGATLIRFRHNAPDDLDRRLSRSEHKNANRLVIVESLYSMLGDKAPLDEFVEITGRHGAEILVDEAHALGVFGNEGQGLASEMGLDSQVDYVVGTFSKSLGSVGGFGASDNPKFDMLRYASRPYMFTASSSPANIEAAISSLKLMRARPELRTQLWQNGRNLHAIIAGHGYEICAPAGPIIAVHMADEPTAIDYWNRLLSAGVYVNLALPPGTPEGMCLLRCSLSASHSDDDVERIGEAFAQIKV